MPRRQTPAPTDPAFADPATDATPLGTDGPAASAIAERAYELYEARGRTPGGHDDDWLQAERELRQRRTDTDAAVSQLGGGAPVPAPPVTPD